EGSDVCGDVGSPRAFSDFVSGFVGADVSGDQRPLTGATFHSATGADAVVCVIGSHGIGVGLRTTLFSGAKGRGSAISEEGRPAGGSNPALGGEKWIWRNAGRGTASAADTVQVFCAGGGSVRSAAGELRFSDFASAVDSLFWSGLSF